MSLPTRAETHSLLIEHLRKAQEESAKLAHLTRDDDQLQAQGWLAISEMLGQTCLNVTKLATRGRLN